MAEHRRSAHVLRPVRGAPVECGIPHRVQEPGQGDGTGQRSNRQRRIGRGGRGLAAVQLHLDDPFATSVDDLAEGRIARSSGSVRFRPVTCASSCREKWPSPTGPRSWSNRSAFVAPPASWAASTSSSEGRRRGTAVPGSSIQRRTRKRRGAMRRSMRQNSSRGGTAPSPARTCTATWCRSASPIPLSSRRASRPWPAPPQGPCSRRSRSHPAGSRPFPPADGASAARGARGR